MPTNPIVIAFGTFDGLESRHLSLLESASRHGPLIVGVSTDDLSLRKHAVYPRNDFQARATNVRALGCVHGVFAEERLELRAEYIKRHNAEIMILNPKWKGRFDKLAWDCQILYYGSPLDLD